MSYPNIPDLNPHIQLKREEVINLLLTSIALEEISFSHLLNAEGEKLQQALRQPLSLGEILALQRGMERTLRNTLKAQMLNQFKLEDILDWLRQQPTDENCELPMFPVLEEKEPLQVDEMEEVEEVEEVDADDVLELEDDDTGAKA